MRDSRSCGSCRLRQSDVNVDADRFLLCASLLHETFDLFQWRSRILGPLTTSIEQLLPTHYSKRCMDSNSTQLAAWSFQHCECVFSPCTDCVSLPRRLSWFVSQKWSMKLATVSNGPVKSSHSCLKTFLLGESLGFTKHDPAKGTVCLAWCASFPARKTDETYSVNAWCNGCNIPMT